MPSVTSPTPLVLVVDDEPDIRVMLDRAIRRAGMRVSTAGTAEEALKALHHAPVDVILSDHKMPGMTGLDLLARARALHPRVARFLMTAHPDDQLAQRAVNEARLDRCFIKPMALDEVVRAIREVLEERAAEGARARAFARSFEAMHKALDVRSSAGVPVTVGLREERPHEGAPRRPARFRLTEGEN